MKLKVDFFVAYNAWIRPKTFYFTATKFARQLTTLARSESFLNSNGFNGGLYIPSLDINGKTRAEKGTALNYECPSLKSFQLPLTDIKITDVLHRHKFTLPETNENKQVVDPLLGFQIEQKLPASVSKRDLPMSCNKSLMSEIGCVDLWIERWILCFFIIYRFCEVPNYTFDVFVCPSVIFT